MSRQLFGRKQIFTDKRMIDASNVCEVLDKVRTDFEKNSSDAKYLWDYYRGKTPILGKTKEVRENINHMIAENRAYQIVEFKNATCFGEPVQYISRGRESDNAVMLEAINELNAAMAVTGKSTVDRHLGLWMHIAGVAYRIALPSAVGEDVPFRYYALSPVNTFVVYHSGIEHEPVMACTVVENGTEKTYCCYTDNEYFEIVGGAIKKREPHALGVVPIIEYPLNDARLGAFEIVLPLLDAINELESNRLDDVQQSVNSFLALLGGAMDDETYSRLEEYKMLCLPEGVDAKYLSVALHQADMQVLKDNLYQSVLTICGMPSQSTEATSSSDTGAATFYRGGWQQVGSRAKDTADEFKASEMRFIALVLRILRDTVGTPLRVQDVEVKFSASFTDAILSKTQVLQQLLSAGIDPEIAIATCGIWSDPVGVYIKSKSYLDQWNIGGDDDGVRDDGQSLETLRA